MRLVRAVAAAVLLAMPAAARAATNDVVCVNVARPDCTLTTTALDAALNTSPKLVYLGPGIYDGTFGSGARVELVGIGAPMIRGNMKLSGQAVAVHNLTVTGELAVGPGDVKLDDLDLGYLTVERSTFRGRGLTVAYGVSANGGTLRLVSSLIRSPVPFTLNGGAQVTTAYSAHKMVDGVVADNLVAPPDDPLPGPGSPLLDKGDPAALAEREPLEDITGAPRVGGDTLRRDIGAYEYHGPVVPPPAQSVLVNGGAEQGLGGWAGNFEVALYGDPFFPTLRGAQLFGAGTRFFSAGAQANALLSQRLDLTKAAAKVDRGGQTAVFSGMLGGYAADADEVDAQAVFKDPENRVLGTLSLGPLTRDGRARDTTMLRREVRGRVPRRTRAIDVKLIGRRKAGGYTDAYLDQLGLALSFSGVVSRAQSPDITPVKGLRPFAGARVLDARLAVRSRVSRFNVACPSSTVRDCSGAVRLASATARFRVDRGDVLPVRLRLSAATARHVRRAHRVAAELSLVAHDGQALERTTVVPVTLVAARPPARGRGT